MPGPDNLLHVVVGGAPVGSGAGAIGVEPVEAAQLAPLMAGDSLFGRLGTRLRLRLHLRVWLGRYFQHPRNHCIAGHVEGFGHVS